MELYSRRWGANPTPDPTGRTKLVLLHGMGGTGQLWRPVAASLEEKFEILAPDQRGHGQSRVESVPGGRTSVNYTPLDYGRDVVETMEREDFHPAILIGHSMGVRTACAVAHLRPDFVRGLILIDLGFSGQAGGGLGDNLGNFVRKLPQEFTSRAEARTFMDAECPDPAIAQYLMAVSQPTPTGGVHFPFDHAALVETIVAARDSSVREWIRESARSGMPVLALRGANSLVWPEADYEHERQALAEFPSVRFETVANAGHGLPFERRVEFVARVKSWIESDIGDSVQP